VRGGRSRAKTGKARPLPGALKGTGAALTLLAAAAGLLAYLDERHWTLDTLAHFRLQWGAVLVLALLVLLVVRRWALAGLVAAAAVATVAPLLAYALVDDARCAADAPALRVMSMNLLSSNPDRRPALDLVREELPDVLFLMEVDAAWMDALEEALGALYPHRVGETREDDFGIALFSRVPFTGGVVYLATPLPSIVVRVERPDGAWTVVATHPTPPVSRESAHRRDLQLDGLAARVRAAREPTLVMGDLNTTPWAASFRKLLESAELRDSGEGGWPEGTWGGPVSALGIPIDHVLLSRDLCVVERRLGADIGSDHRALVVAVARR